jgi:hypothetical protein
LQGLVFYSGGVECEAEYSDAAPLLAAAADCGRAGMYVQRKRGLQPELLHGAPPGNVQGAALQRFGEVALWICAKFYVICSYSLQVDDPKVALFSLDVRR